MLGQRCTPGTAKSTYGTGCFVLLHTGPRPVSSGHGLLTTMAYRLGPNAEPQYALEVQLVCRCLEASCPGPPEAQPLPLWCSKGCSVHVRR